MCCERKLIGSKPMLHWFTVTSAVNFTVSAGLAEGAVSLNLFQFNWSTCCNKFAQVASCKLQVRSSYKFAQVTRQFVQVTS